MKSSRTTRLFHYLLGLALLAAGTLNAPACAVCFGDPTSPTSRALNWAILALGGLVVCVLAVVVAFFVHVSRNSRRLAALAESASKA